MTEWLFLAIKWDNIYKNEIKWAEIAVAAISKLKWHTTATKETRA